MRAEHTPNRPYKKEKDTNIRPLDPHKLMKGNFAFYKDALNPEALIGKKFDPMLYTPVDYVEVQYPNGKVETKLWDGHNRTEKAAHYLETPQGKTYTFLGRDVTDKVLSHEFPDHTSPYLNLNQYLESLRRPTKKEQLNTRMAGHVVTEWDRLVGKQASDKYPVLVALSFLSFSDLGFEDPVKLTKKLPTYNKLFIGETPRVRQQVESGLASVAKIIREAKLVYEDVTEPAFDIARDSFTPMAIQREAQGFLALPVLYQKIMATDDKELQKERFEETKKLIQNAIRTSGKIRDRRALYATLTNPEILYEKLVAILQEPEKISFNYQLAKNELKPNERRRHQKVPPQETVILKDDYPQKIEAVQVNSPKIIDKIPDREALESGTTLSQLIKKCKEAVAQVDDITKLSEEERRELWFLGKAIGVAFRKVVETSQAAGPPKSKEVFVAPQEKTPKKEYTEKDYQAITQKIDQAAKAFFPELRKDWETIKGAVRKNRGSNQEAVGLDAIRESLTERLAHLMDHMGLDQNSEEFKYLSASHYFLAINGLVTQHPDDTLQEYREKMKKTVNRYLEPQTQRKRDENTTMQFVLYARPDDPLTKKAMQLLPEGRNLNRIAQDAYDAYEDYVKKYHQPANKYAPPTIQDLFNFQVLGIRVSKEDPYPETPLTHPLTNE